MARSKPEPVTTAESIARLAADQAMGGTFDELVADCERAHRALEAWTAAYRTTLLANVANPAARPPLNTKEAALRMSCSETRIRELLFSGQLRRVPNLGRSVRISQDEIDRFISGK